MQGDALTVLKSLPDKLVNTCVTSPPYFGLRDYGMSGQIGLESTPEEYVSNLVEVFREVKRVLRDDGTVWLNLGDSYAANRGYQVVDSKHTNVGNNKGSKVPEGLKPKDLIGIPWMAAFALRADGWYLRQDIIWSKPNAMPESVRDRPTKAHEYIFLLSKSQKYYYDTDAIAEPSTAVGPTWSSRKASGEPMRHGLMGAAACGSGGFAAKNGLRNKRSVWTVNTKPFKGAHFATFPELLIEPCILAGCPEGGIVLDPFAGAGTTGVVSAKNNRNFIGIELNPEYVEMATNRILNIEIAA